MKLFIIAVSAVLFVGSAYAKVPHPSPKGATAASVPGLDVKKVCQNSSLGTDACLTEEDAREMLVEKWSSFSAGDKSSCYNEMMTLARHHAMALRCAANSRTPSGLEGYPLV
jgi:hypothetical protein